MEQLRFTYTIIEKINVMIVRIRVQPKDSNDTSEHSINVGSAKVLSGKIHILSIFVGSKNQSWESEDIHMVKQQLYEAERWLKSAASRYGENVEFYNTAFGSDGTFVDNDIPEGSHIPNAYFYPSYILKKVGFKSETSYVDWMKHNTSCEQCLVILFCNKQGRSYASPTNTDLLNYNSDKFNLECCLLYRYYSDSLIETTTASIAHEILHLFGAWDLYELDDSDRIRAQKCAQMFPKSIMYDTYRDIWETQIDEITAWLVGLKSEGKDWYRWFEPHQEVYYID